MFPLRVLILGKEGMAGHVIYELLKDKYILFSTSRNEKKSDSVNHGYFDFSKLDDFNRVIEFIATNKIEIVINCIGVLNNFCNTNTYESIAVNSLFPLYLDRYSDKIGYRLIHISTDCVFSGNEGGYTEKSIRDGLSLYAKTKALGEEIKNPNNILIRTSIIGPEIKNGIGLLDWFLTQTEKIEGYTKVYWSGVTTVELAKKIIELIENNFKGFIHLTNNEKISKYDLLQIVNTVFDRGITIEANDRYTSDKSILNTEHLDIHIPSYNYMIKEMYSYIINHKNIYKKYFFDV